VKRTFVLFFLASSCSSDVLVELSTPEGFDHGTQLLFVSIEGGRPEVYARDLEVGPFYLPGTFTRGETLELEAWLLEASLEELGLNSGFVPVEPEGVEGRFLYAPSEVRHGVIMDDRSPKWSSLSEPSKEARALRLAGRVDDCLTMGGCFSESDLCEYPCHPQMPSPPIPPTEPTFLGCERGWSGAADETPGSRCEPWVASCPFGLLSQSTGHCESESDPCETPILEGPGFYVFAEARSGGDGSLLTPYRTIGEALSSTRAVPRTIVLLPGDYRETVTVRDALTIVGACPARTILSELFVLSGNGEVHVSRVTLSSVLASSTRVTLEQSYLRGDGALAEFGGTLVLRDVAFEGAPLLVRGVGTEVTVERATFRGEGSAIQVSGGAQLIGSEVWMTESGGISALGLPTTLVLTDVVVDGAVKVAGVFAAECAMALNRVLIFGTASGMELLGAQVRLSDVDVRHPLGGGIGMFGLTPSTTTPTTLVERVRITGAKSLGLEVRAALLEGTDLTISDTSLSDVDVSSHGMRLASGIVELSRVVIERQTHAAFLVGNGTFTLTDVQLRDNRAGALLERVLCTSAMCVAPGKLAEFSLETDGCAIFDRREGPLTLNEGSITTRAGAFCGKRLEPGDMPRVYIDGPVEDGREP
jgi:hypothetical protein